MAYIGFCIAAPPVKTRVAPWQRFD